MAGRQEASLMAAGAVVGGSSGGRRNGSGTKPYSEAGLPVIAGPY